MHILEINQPISMAQDGLMLGNGDLSVSIYQRHGEIVWRFGKGDVWDRRHATSDDPIPMSLDELRHGLANEGWTCPAYGGEIQALKGTKNRKRMLDVLSASPSQTYPYPMPKPVGELSLRWPADLQELKISQKLFIEEGRVEIYCQWHDGETLCIDCFIPPNLNILVVKWKFQDWHPGSPQPFFKNTPILLSLYRWADPNIVKFNAEWIAKYNYHGFEGMVNPKATPLPPPKLLKHGAHSVIEQSFYPDNTYSEGFKYWLGCITDLPYVEHAPTESLGEARLFMSSESSTSLADMADFIRIDKRLRLGEIEYPEGKTYEGWIAVPVTTSSDIGGEITAFEKICDEFKNTPDLISILYSKTIDTAKKFWSQSSIKTSESTLERLWYETLHISKCVLKKGAFSPGLFLPSTINDYSMWHGDYHTNYNIQQPFWGFHASNHPELVEPFFEIMDHFHYLGSKIARDYCGTRGCFIQLSSYPMTMEHDPIPTSPMSRMPYMTGWVPELFWRHFLYTNDIEFLKSRAYPFIRDCALFYTDFLSLGKDGLYHAFPSCWGEEGFDGDVDTSTDALQTIEYAASCLSMALQAAEVLGIDPDLQKAWKERISKLAPGRGENEWRPLPEANDNRHRQFNVPAFRPGENYRFPNRWPFAKRWWGWIDKLVISLIRDVRNGRFNESDYHDLLKVIHRWRHPNGLLWAMPERFYGSCGGWFEILGIIMPLQEMMLQSWDGVIRIFPVWVGETIAQFENLRAEGAFLVSAGYNNGITYVRIESLSGTACVLLNPWPSKKVKVVDSNTKKTIIEADTDILKFDTQPGSKYQLMCN